MEFDVTKFVEAARAVGFKTISGLAHVSGLDRERLQKAIGAKLVLSKGELVALAQAIGCQPQEFCSGF